MHAHSARCSPSCDAQHLAMQVRNGGTSQRGCRQGMEVLYVQKREKKCNKEIEIRLSSRSTLSQNEAGAKSSTY